MNALSMLVSIATNIICMAFVIFGRNKYRIPFSFVAALFLSGVVLVIPVGLVESLLLAGQTQSTITFGQGLIIGFLEEAAKWCATAAFITRVRRMSRTGFQTIDGIMCGIAVNEGASFLENLFSMVSGGSAMARALASLSYVTYGAIAGAVIVSFLEASERGAGLQALPKLIGGFALAVLVHALWDSAYLTFYSVAFVIPGLFMLAPALMNAYYVVVALAGICYTIYQYTKSRRPPQYMTYGR